MLWQICWVPNVSPNAITLAAIASNVVLWLSTELFHVPTALLTVVLCAIQMLNALDGVQARRTNNTTVLGELLNHLCRICTLFVFIRSQEIAYGVDSTLLYVIASYSICYKHFRAVLDGYTTNYTGIGNTDIIFVIGSVYIMDLISVCKPLLILFGVHGFFANGSYRRIIMLHVLAAYMGNGLQLMSICIVLSLELVSSKMTKVPFRNIALVPAGIALMHPLLGLLVVLSIVFATVSSVDTQMFVSKPVAHIKPKLVFHFNIDGTVLVPPSSDTADSQAKVLLAKNIYGTVVNGQWHINFAYTTEANSVSYYTYLQDKTFAEQMTALNAFTEKGHPGEHIRTVYEQALKSVKRQNLFESLHTVCAAYPLALIVLRSYHMISTEVIDAVTQLHPVFGVARRSSDTNKLIVGSTACHNLAEINDYYRKTTGILLIHDDSAFYSEASLGGGRVLLSDPDLIQLQFAADNSSDTDYFGYDNICSFRVNTVEAMTKPKYFVDMIEVCMIQYVGC